MKRDEETIGALFYDAMRESGIIKKTDAQLSALKYTMVSQLAKVVECIIENEAALKKSASFVSWDNLLKKKLKGIEPSATNQFLNFLFQIGAVLELKGLNALEERIKRAYPQKPGYFIHIAKMVYRYFFIVRRVEDVKIFLKPNIQRGSMRTGIYALLMDYAKEQWNKKDPIVVFGQNIAEMHVRNLNEIIKAQTGDLSKRRIDGNTLKIFIKDLVREGSLDTTVELK